MRALLYFSLLFSFWACNRSEAPLPDLSETGEETPIPEEGKPPVSSVPAFALPQSLNPSGRVLLLKRLKTVVSYGTKMVDTTVYQYNTNGEVIAEFFTNFMAGKHDGGSKKYRAYPENLGSADKTYAYITNGSRITELYCDDQKRVMKARKDNVITYYEYDQEGRLSRTVDSSFNTASVTTYSYFSKNETGLSYDYYTVRSASETVTYILSGTVKTVPPVKYLFNYGKGQEYAVERKITNAYEISYSYQFSENNRIQEQNYTLGQYDHWVKYIY
ncbi:MAG: hypothetical protein LRY55_00445 [Leadbetterella sp.]|nr:hypothetical protein [Leadbetterella sp.]